MEKLTLTELFDRYFELVPARTPELLDRVYRLRYEVYCDEAKLPGFDVRDYPNGRERDEYDRRAVHSLMMHKQSGDCAGTVRIILPDPEDPNLPFPMEIHARDRFSGDQPCCQNLDRQRVGEVSRLILAHRFRSRRGEDDQPQGAPVDPGDIPWPSDDLRPGSAMTGAGTPTARQDANRTNRRQFPHAVLGLIKAAVQMSLDQRLSHCYAAMEPVCARLLRYFGLDFEPISAVIDYHGSCRAYITHLPTLLEGVYDRAPAVWDFVTDHGRIGSRPDPD
jgi:N-acyl-L-homoserine lactone synthetase